MAFKSILVSLNETDRNEVLLPIAIGLAQLFDAHLTGLYIIPAAKIYPSAAFEPIPAIYEALRNYFVKQKAGVKTVFDKAMSTEPVRNDLRILESSSPLVSDLFIEHGRETDLIVVSQTNLSGESGVELDFVARVAIAVGRPVLVIPRSGVNKLLLDTIIIGWNGSREATRATFDSLPFLRCAKDVRIVWVDPEEEFYKSGVLPGAELAEALSRHGVKAVVEPMRIGREEEPGKALLRKTSDLGAGLLVMGAYGHSRLREFILGGATRTAINTMKCPVLMSH
jgi:nucleotide-binding universal stress UspA family protein